MPFEEPRLVGSDRVHHAAHFDQLAKGFANDRKVTAGRLAVSSRKMVHTHFFDCHAKPGCLSEDFRVNHRAHALDSDAAEDITIEDFESAVNVTDPDPEHEPH